MRMVFMGTPDFAVNSLERLIADGHDIVGVFTQPDKPQGRKMKLTPPPVKQLALTHNIPVFQPDTFKNESQLALLQELNPDKKQATSSIITFLVLNTSCMTLMPTTVMALRSSAGSADPAAIVLPTVIASGIGMCCGLLLDALLRRIYGRRAL